MITVVIFDLDGLLIDSQPLQYQSYKEVFAQHGHTLHSKDWLQWIHHGVNQKMWIEQNNLDLDHEVIHAQKRKRYAELIDEKMELKPGAHQCITLLRRSGYRLCVASASSLDSVKRIIQKFNLEPEFEYLLSDQDVKMPKPHPHIFLEAARLMGVPPEECVVIEDSLAGFKAAKSAGMKCIICPDPWGDEPVPEYPGADVMVDSLNDVTLEMIQE